MSRPLSYTPELAAKICEKLASCGSLRAVCREEGMPDRNTVMRWVVDNVNGFAAEYARAKSLGIDEFVEETLEIADDGTNDWMMTQHGPQLDSEHVQRSKIRIETRRWLAERMEPKKYGARTGLDVTNSDGTLAVDADARAKRLAALMAQAKARQEAGQGDVDLDDIV